MMDSKFSYVGIREVGEYPLTPYYHDWRDALFNLEDWPMFGGESFDINRWKVGANGVEDRCYLTCPWANGLLARRIQK